jgi:hypothetical protein
MSVPKATPRRRQASSSTAAYRAENADPSNTSRRETSETASSDRASLVAPVVEILSLHDERGMLPPPPPAVVKTRSDSFACVDTKLPYSDFLDASSSSVSGKSLYSERTASTVATSGTIGSFFSEPSIQSSASSSPGKQNKKLVRWNITSSNVKNENIRTTEGRFDRINLNECLRSTRDFPMKPPRRTKSPPLLNHNTLRSKKELGYEMERLEARIQKAARMELTILNNAKMIEGKRERLAQAFDKLQEKLRQRPHKKTTTSSVSKENLMKEIKTVQEKISKADRIEISYLRKAKDVHDKRYRWTQLYGNACREWQQQTMGSSESSPVKNLPPLLPSSVFKKCVSTKYSSSKKKPSESEGNERT